MTSKPTLRIHAPVPRDRIKNLSNRYLGDIDTGSGLTRVPLGEDAHLYLEEANRQGHRVVFLHATGSSGRRVEFKRHRHPKGERNLCIEGCFIEYIENESDLDSLLDDGSSSFAEFRRKHNGVVGVGTRDEHGVPLYFYPGASWSFDEDSTHKPHGIVGEGGHLLGEGYTYADAEIIDEVTDGPAPEIHSIGVLGYHRCGEQDTLAPWEIFRSLAYVLGLESPPRKLTVDLIGLDQDLIEMQMGARVARDVRLSSSTTYDLLYVPGGLGSGDASKNRDILRCVRRHHEERSIIATNCSGISILHRAGILGDAPVTAAATVSRKLLDEGANVRQPRRMWVGAPEARIWTTAGGSGVHASTVALIAHYFGRELGQTIAMMWDTLPALGSRLFDVEGPEYYDFRAMERELQTQYEDQLLPDAH